jgi:hypothetical protein
MNGAVGMIGNGGAATGEIEPPVVTLLHGPAGASGLDNEEHRTLSESITS